MIDYNIQCWWTRGYTHFQCGHLSISRHFPAFLIETYNCRLRMSMLLHPYLVSTGPFSWVLRGRRGRWGREYVSGGMTYISSLCFGSKQWGKVKKLMMFVTGASRDDSTPQSGNSIQLQVYCGSKRHQIPSLATRFSLSVPGFLGFQKSVCLWCFHR